MQFLPTTVLFAALASLFYLRVAGAADEFSPVWKILESECIKCHGPEKQKGGLRLDSAAFTFKGGDTGLVIKPNDPEGSLLVQAIRQTGDLTMPPKSKLSAEKIQAIEQWVRSGALWPGTTVKLTSNDWAPDQHELKRNLELWLSAQDLPLQDNAKVYRWPDRSGHFRDASPNAGVFSGAGSPPTFVKNSSLSGKPAIRFEAGNGLATPGDRPVSIMGDAAFSIIVVANLKRNDLGASSDVLVGFGEPLDFSNTSPGRSAASLLQIDRTPEARHRLDHAGGLRRDALIGRPGSFASFYDTPVIITLVKQPGSMRETSLLYVNGELIDRVPPSGADAAPDIRSRKDFAVILGHAFNETGSILGDLAEVVIYNSALSLEQKTRLESHFATQYHIKLDSDQPATVVNSVPANARNHWAFRKKSRPPLPSLNSPLVSTPVDAFLLKRLVDKNLTYSPEADKRTLLRRAFLDVTGLPPTPVDLATFESDSSSDPFASLIDRLLNSPHFGERWGRHWLDQVGYVDVLGNDQNAEQIILGHSKWKYRDYVIRSFNQDKPFDQFLREQIAGDELTKWRHAETYAPEIREKLIATGYLRTAIDDTHEVDLNKVPFRYQVLFDTVQLVGNSLFGLTLQCARCHDHKFDPISQRDFYQFMGVFTPAFNPHNWLQPKDRELPELSQKELAPIQARNAELDRKIQPLQEKLNALPADKKTERERLQNAISTLNKQRATWETIRAFVESDAPPRNYIFVRGDHDRRGERVEPGFLSVLAEMEPGLSESNWTRIARSSDASEPDHRARRDELRDSSSTGRRLAFAQWVTDPNSRAAALTARVFVNRLWQQLFGEGLTPTPDNFGVKGSPPTHPELLEWLIAEFVESGWKIKPLLRQMLLSRAYRQGSAILPGNANHANAMNADSENILLWRMRLRRAESEVIRDSILTVSGKFDPRMSGPAVPLITLPDGSVSLPPDDKLPSSTAKYRRTIYLMSRRNFHLPLLGSFDQPVINNACARRMSSSVVLQPLSMLNDPFVLEQSAAVAQRVIAAAGSDLETQIEIAFTLVLTRAPSSAELHWSKAYIADQQANFASNSEALTVFCQMLMNTSEFLYIQ